jgi:hypothetical protein
MENQQERFKDIGWLCGIIDGEGTVTLRFHARKGKTPLIIPAITIINTDKQIIDKCIEILNRLDIPMWVNEYQASEKWRKRYRIEVSGIRRAMKFLPFLSENLIGKREEAALVLEWCNNRYSKVSTKRRYYDEWDLSMVRKVKLLHGHQDKVEKSLKILRDYMPNIEK